MQQINLNLINIRLELAKHKIQHPLFKDVLAETIERADYVYKLLKQNGDVLPHSENLKIESLLKEMLLEFSSISKISKS
jgi:hypothetical protein